MYRQGFFRPGIIGMSAISGIEQACWDIYGKSLGLPVYQLLGGQVRDHIRMYDHLGGGEMRSLYLQDTVEQMTARAHESLAAGYTALKVLVVPRTEPLEGSKPLRQAETLFGGLRDAVGPDVDLMIDFHARTTPIMAIQYGKVLEQFKPYFLEEVCPPENVDGMVEVARALSTPLATGERLITRFEFRELFEKRACAVIQPDICHCGGLWEARKIAAMAEAYYISVAPHNPLGPVATAAAVQFGFATPTYIIQEAIRSDVPWRDEVVNEPLIVRDGYIYPTDKPGLGIEVNEAAAAKHPFEQEVLMNWFHPEGSVADW
jgi:galactonate dehydratase